MQEGVGETFSRQANRIGRGPRTDLKQKKEHIIFLFDGRGGFSRLGFCFFCLPFLLNHINMVFFRYNLN